MKNYYRKIFSATGIFSLLLFVSSVCLVAAEPAPPNVNTGTLSNNVFTLQVDPRGITSLKRTDDSFDTDYIREGSGFGDILLAYRVGSSEWQRVSTAELTNRCEFIQTDSGYRLVFSCGPETRPDVHLTVSYTLTAEKLYWTLSFSNRTTEKIEIGDIGLSFPFNTRYTWDKQTTLTKRVLRHSFISGHGSFMFWLRCNSVGPYLVMTPGKGTHLEYFELQRSRVSRNRDYCAYIHSAMAVAQAKKNGGNWRQPGTSVTLSPHGTPGDSVAYGFEFSWADGYDGVRQTLYENGGLDTEVVPGMTLPLGLSAEICLRTKKKITAITAEYPNETSISYHGEKNKDSHVYEVTFTRLGENMLTVRYGSNQHMYLEFFVTEPVETLIKKRAAFLVNTHQHRDTNKWYDGVFADWNMSNHTLLSPDNLDSISSRQEYMITCDDPGLGKAPLVASKNVNYPDTNEIAALDYYIEQFVWGGLQMTDTEPYPYGIYGIHNWKKNRESNDPGPGGKQHVWRIYDYPHIVLLYYRMYQIATYYPEIPLHISKEEYLKRAYGTACAFFTVPSAVKGWSAYMTGTYNEMIIPSLLDALHEAGLNQEEANLRMHWERKVQKFVSGEVNPFGSEYAFDSTGFESTHAFARYAMQHCLADNVGNTNAAFRMKRSEAKEFMERQIAYNIFCRGWLECAYYHYGSDYRGESSRYTLTYMSQMGGWSILDYGLYYAEDPFPYLRLGYASYLSSWALMNSGTPESNYGYWYPGKENDGGAGGGFEPAAYARNWLGQSQPRGSWAHSCEIDLGFNGALRTSATVVADDPIFGMTAMGGTLRKTKTGIMVIPKDGLQRRFHMVTASQRLHLILKRDGFLAKQGIQVAEDYSRISFHVENRWPHYHETKMVVSGLPEGKYRVTVDGTVLTMLDMKEGEEAAVMIPVNGEHVSRKIEILRREK